MNTKEHIEESAAKVAALGLTGLWFASLHYESVNPADVLALHQQYGGGINDSYKGFTWSGKIEDVHVTAECRMEGITANAVKPSAAERLAQLIGRTAITPPTP